MNDLRGKVAVITGGANGIGLAIAESLGREGCKIYLLDFHEPSLALALQQLNDQAIEADGTLVDVRSRASVEAGAKQVIARFGRVHILCNNAGVSTMGAIGSLKPGDWDWVRAVNFDGVVYGVETFVPLIQSHGGGGHIVNTASMAGFVSPPEAEPYAACKAAVIAMTEGWAQQCAPKGIGMSVLCPGLVDTNIAQCARLYPEDEDVTDSTDHPLFKSVRRAGAPPHLIARRVLEGIRENQLYIFTHVETWAPLLQRFKAITRAFDDAAVNPTVTEISKYSEETSPA